MINWHNSVHALSETFCVYLAGIAVSVLVLVLLLILAYFLLVPYFGCIRGMGLL